MVKSIKSILAQNTKRRRSEMVAYCVFVPGMKVSELMRFVDGNIPPLEELFQEARERNIPEECRCCGATLEDCVNQYQEIPSSDATITFLQMGQGSVCVQPSAGRRSCCKMKDGLRIIVRDHLARRLRRAGTPCTVHKF